MRLNAPEAAAAIAFAFTFICVSTTDRAAAGAGGSPSAPAVTPAPPSVEAINAFSIPPLDISQDETGAAGAGLVTKCRFILAFQGWCYGIPGCQLCGRRSKRCSRRGPGAVTVAIA
jgi:hypothetical protein